MFVIHNLPGFTFFLQMKEQKVSHSSRDNSSPYAKTPHHHGPVRRVEFAGPMHEFVIREMGDTRDENHTVKAETLDDACRAYAKTKWRIKAAFLLPVYCKVEGERYLRCVDPSGKVEVMPW